MTLVHETGFVIRHSRLHTTGVIAQDVSSSKIKECLERNFLVEGIDYNLLAVNGQQDLKQHGGINKNIYMLTPCAFKKCLIRSKNTQVYAN